MGTRGVLGSNVQKTKTAMVSGRVLRQRPHKPLPQANRAYIIFLTGRAFPSSGRSRLSYNRMMERDEMVALFTVGILAGIVTFIIYNALAR